VDITEGVQSVVDQSGVDTALASVFVPDATAGVSVTDGVVSASETIPVRGGRLELGPGQQILLVELEGGPGLRTVLVRVVE
jgi:thiamine phosphate synthase YjbQ (UPF0047 family)